MKTTLLLLGFLIPLYCLFSIVFWSWKNGISPTPTSRKQLEAVLEIVPRPPHGTILELGSGWGTLALALAKAFPDNPVIGYESSPVPYHASRLLNGFHRRPNLEFRRSDFLHAPLPQSYLIVCYLYPGGMKNLQQKLQNESNVCIWLVSNTFALPDTKPFHVTYSEDVYRSPVYLYRIANNDMNERKRTSKHSQSKSV